MRRRAAPTARQAVEGGGSVVVAVVQQGPPTTKFPSPPPLDRDELFKRIRRGNRERDREAALELIADVADSLRSRAARRWVNGEDLLEWARELREALAPLRGDR